MKQTRRIARAGAALTLLATGACEKEIFVPEEPEPAHCAVVDAAVAGFDAKVLTPDDKWEAVARIIPGGFGGITGAGSTSTEIYLLEPARFAEARSVASQAVTCRNASKVQELGYVTSASGARQGRWDYIQLRGWYTKILEGVDQSIDLRSSDIAEAENRLSFEVRTVDSALRLRLLASRLNVPTDAVFIRITTSGG